MDEEWQETDKQTNRQTDRQTRQTRQTNGKKERLETTKSWRDRRNQRMKNDMIDREGTDNQEERIFTEISAAKEKKVRILGF